MLQRNGQPQQRYMIDLDGEIGLFRHHHMKYSRVGILDTHVDDYIRMTLEQMINHFEVQRVAVQSFVEHYTTLITERTSSRFRYHPHRYIRDMSNEDYQQYVYCLYGFAESVYRRFQDHGMFNANGILTASFERLDADNTLHLVIRPEVPDVFN